MWLEEKYLSIVSSRLSLFAKKKRGVFNCRCPYCGDSRKSKTKARGYFYDRAGKMFYTCKNCGRGTTFPKFLEWFSPEDYKAFKMEMFMESAPLTTPQTKQLDFSYKAPEVKEVPDILKGLESISSLDDDHFAKKYVIERGIPKSKWSNLYYAKNIKVISSQLEDYEETGFDDFPRLILPFYDKDMNLTYVQGRAIGYDEIPKDKRYITLELVKDAFKVFGYETLDLTKQVYVVEGPIDSMFLNNCIAAAGSDLHDIADALNIPPDQITIILDKEPRNKEIVKIMDKCITKGYNVCIIPEGFLGKDINDFVKNGYNVDEMIRKNTFRGLKAKMRMATWKK